MKYKAFSFLFILLLFMPLMQHAFSAAVIYDESALNWNFTTLTGGNFYLLDVNGNGKVDTIYKDGPYTTSTKKEFVKVYDSGLVTTSNGLNGTGSFSFSSSNVVTLNNGTIWFARLSTTSTSCSFSYYGANMITGTDIGVKSNSIGGLTEVLPSLSHVGAIKFGNDYLIGGTCFANVGGARLILQNSTHTLHNSNGAETTTNSVMHASGINKYFFPNGTTKTTYFPLMLHTFWNTATSGTVLETLSSTLTFGPPPNNPSGIYADSNIRMWNWGIELPSKNVEKESLWYDYMPSPIHTNMTFALYAHPALFGFSTDSPPFRFILEHTSGNRVGFIDGSTIKYITQNPDLSSRAIQWYFMQDYPPTFTSVSTGSALPNGTYFMQKPSGNAASYYTGFGFYSVSGYIPFRDPTISRSYDPAFTNNPSLLMPIFSGPKTGLTSLTIQMQNLPHTDFAMDFRDALTFESYNISWSVDELTADKSVTADIPTSRCVDLYIKDISKTTSTWTSLGNICASGTMPKILSYIQNLAYTFWTFEWGVNHSYDQQTEGLQTHVRGDADPYVYNVQLYDSNNNLVSDTLHSGDTEFDVQDFNTTGYDKPIRLIVRNADNQTIYHATLGFPNYLSQIGSFYNQYLTIDGFHLLAFMPIIFASMFTRNTVGIGSVLTVVFIATMSWLGLISIPDAILYLLIFIAIIGTIAYKTWHD